MNQLETATFAGGCFWCTEAIYRRIKGVEDVISGYTGGNVSNPSYDDVCSGKTGHAEAVQIRFDPSVISYKELLEIFFKTHDPTSLNKQGNDIGTQYRSAIFYVNENQKNQAKELIKTLGDRIVTTVEPLGDFYIAEDYHQKFYENNGAYPYCRVVIDPKIRKLQKEFINSLKQ